MHSTPLIRWKRGSGYVRARVCDEASPGNAEDPENPEKCVKTRPLTSSSSLVLRGTLETPRRLELLGLYAS